MVERKKQNKINGSEVNRTIEQRQIAAPRVMHAHVTFFFGEKRVWLGASMPRVRETPDIYMYMRFVPESIPMYS